MIYAEQHKETLKNMGEIAREMMWIKTRLKDTSIELSTVSELTNALKEKKAEYNRQRALIFAK